MSKPEVVRIKLGEDGYVTVTTPGGSCPKGEIVINDGHKTVFLNRAEYVTLRNAVEGRYTYRPDLIQEIEEEGFYTDCLLSQPDGVALLDEMVDAFVEQWNEEQVMATDSRNYYGTLEYIVDSFSERLRAFSECSDDCFGCSRKEVS